MTPTRRDEFALLSDNGLYFISIHLDEQTERWDMPQVDPSEVYTSARQYSVFVEYDYDKFLLGSIEKPHFLKIDRKAEFKKNEA